MEKAITILFMCIIGLAVLLLTGCNHTQERLNTAATVEAGTRVQIRLPDLPPSCREDIPMVVPKVGEKFRHTQSRWEVVRDNENRTKQFCAGFYDETKAAIENTPAKN